MSAFCHYEYFIAVTAVTHLRDLDLIVSELPPRCHPTCAQRQMMTITDRLLPNA
jgi:hypothetical protein